MVVAAHPDDEILGCGGTLLKHICQGDELYVLILGEGITSRTSVLQQEREKRVNILESAVKKVGHFMGWKKLFTFKLNDNRFDSIDLLDIVKIVEKAKEEVNPQVVYTHHFGDLNIDHRITHEAVVTAFRPLAGSSCRRILTFETPSSTEWATPSSSRSFMPNIYVDITDTIERKCKAFEIYESELCVYPHPRSVKALKAAAQYRGIQVGMEYAEVFSLVRELL